jgi:protein-disulfide isomerase
MTPTTGTNPRILPAILLVSLAAVLLCACCVVVGAGAAIILLRPTPHPSPAAASLPSSTRTPTVFPAAETPTNTDSAAPKDDGVTPAAKQNSESDAWHTIGLPEAPVLIEEFVDYQCPFYGRFSDRAESRLREEYIDQGKVRFFFRNLIVVDGFIPDGYESRSAALRSLCAGAQGKYWECHDVLFENRSGEDEGAFATPRLVSFATALDLREDDFRQCLKDKTYKYVLEDDEVAAREYGIDAVPAFMINGEVTIGFEGEGFFPAIDEALSDAGR